MLKYYKEMADYYKSWMETTEKVGCESDDIEDLDDCFDYNFKNYLKYMKLYKSEIDKLKEEDTNIEINIKCGYLVDGMCDKKFSKYYLCHGIELCDYMKTKEDTLTYDELFDIIKKIEKRVQHSSRVSKTATRSRRWIELVLEIDKLRK